MPSKPVWLDFSLPVHNGMPVYPGDPPVRIEHFLEHGRDGLQASVLSMSCHAGTHLDVPRHYLPQGPSVDMLDPGRFTGPAYIAAAVYNGRGEINLDALDLSGLVPGDSLLLATGWDQNRGQAAYYQNIPCFAPGAGACLVQLQIGFFGLDLPTVGEAGSEPAAMHQTLLSRDIVIIESLSGLVPLVGKRVQLFAFPLLLPGSDGSPVRACGYLLGSNCILVPDGL
jgi:kynurenine formamidase